MKTHLSIVLIAIGSLLLSCSDDNITGTKKYRLSVSVNPSESGTVIPSSGEYEEGEEIQITATPNQHWFFSSWEGDHTGTGFSFTILMDRDKNISALFAKREYPFTVEIEGKGAVNERIVQQKTTDYESGTTIELTAVADDGWQFSHWEDDIEGSGNPISIVIDGEITIKAVFERNDYPLTINIVGNGTVSEKIVHSKTIDYPYQTVVELTANPSEGWLFSGWDGDLTGNDNSARIEIKDATEVTATFVRDYFNVSIVLDGEGIIDVDLISGNQSEGSFEYESEISIKILPSSGWRFVTWEGYLSGAENPIEVIVTGNISAIAVLEQVPFEGEGTITTPYQIETLEQLQAIREPRFLDNHFVQVGDIDATATATWNGGQGFMPIGFHDSNRFTGTYNGGGFQITGLHINLTSGYYFGSVSAGLFGYVDHGSIKNLILNDVNIIANSTVSVGGLAGFVGSGSRIENVQVSGSVLGHDNVGGLVGILASSEISNLTADVTVNGNNYIGGLIGNSNESRVNASRANGNVTGNQNVGGLIGHQTFAKMITISFATGDITGTTNVGGLIGASINTSQMIRIVHATGDISGNQNVGGLIGIFGGSGVITETYAAGNISSTDGTYIGGLIGRMLAGKIYKSYSLGDVSGNNGIGGLIGRNDADGHTYETFSAGMVSGSLDVGGFIGSNQGTLTSSYWDIQTSNKYNSVGDGLVGEVAGLSTSQMIGTNAQDNMTGFDWVNTWNTSQSYPVLKVFTTLE